MFYADNGGQPYHLHLAENHGGLQVYALKKGNYQDCIVDGHVGQLENGVYSLNEIPYPKCKAVLVRQTINLFHKAHDNLLGTAEYSTPGPDNDFSLKYHYWDFDTFIFATKDHQYFMAMTKEAIGGYLVTPNDFYADQARIFHVIKPGSVKWELNATTMYNRQHSLEDPWISINNHWPTETNQMMYGERGANNYFNNLAMGHHGSHLLAHGGLQVYALMEGNYQDCIVDGHVGRFENGVYALNEVPYCRAVLVRQTISTLHQATDNLRGTIVAYYSEKVGNLKIETVLKLFDHS